MIKCSYKVAFITGMSWLVGCDDGNRVREEDKSPPIPVLVETVGSDRQGLLFTGSGKVEALNSADLSTRMMGFVDKFYVKVGDAVKKGQVLVSINNTDLRAKLAQADAGVIEASAALKNAEKDHDRFKNLFASNSATQKELDNVELRYETAHARLRAAQQMRNEVNAQFSYTHIRAPFDGVVTHKFIETGTMANPGRPLISVESSEQFHVSAMVPESRISKISTDEDVWVRVRSINKKIKGKISEVSASAKNTGGQYLVKVVLGEAGPEVRAGMFASVDFPENDSMVNVMPTILKTAIVRNGQLTGVYTISQSNRALLRWLRLGRQQGDKVEVLSGLTSGEHYIVSSKGKLYNGAKIAVDHHH